MYIHRTCVYRYVCIQIYTIRMCVCAPVSNAMLHMCVFHQRSTDLQPRRLFPVTCSLGGSSEMEKITAAWSPSDVPYV